jgi:O-antigen/teichoic acid export membrane protein
VAGRLLARNAVLNIFGHVAPMAVALVAIPILVPRLGTERFGVLTLAWMLIGYFSLFDLGLGRALTQLIAERLGDGRDAEIPGLTWTALAVVSAIGTLGGVVLFALAPTLAHRLLRVPVHLQPETLLALRLLALALPFVIATAALRGVLEATQRFGVVNALRVPLGIFTYVGPVLVTVFSPSLAAVVAVLAAGRVVAWAAHFVFCIRTLPALAKQRRVDRALVAPLLRFGGWITVSNAVSPLMLYLDRFLIGSLLSMAAVAYYVTPYEVVTKLLVIPGAILGVFFPAFATTAAGGDRARAAELFDRGIRAVFVLIFPAVLILVALAREGLGLWLDAEFAQHSTRVLQWLAVGVLLNSLAHVPAGLVQGVGRPDLTGKLHLAEFPLYLVALWWLVGRYGIEGAAAAWVLRAAVDAVALFVFAARLLPGVRREAVRYGAALFGAGALVAGALLVPAGTWARMAFVGSALPVFVVAAWFGLLSEAERALLPVVGAAGERRPSA